MKRFFTDHPFNNDIIIEVDENKVISFYSQASISRHYERKQMIEDGVIEEDEEEELHPVYWIDSQDWESHVKPHLLRKPWIRKEMLEYIESELNN